MTGEVQPFKGAVVQFHSSKLTRVKYFTMDIQQVNHNHHIWTSYLKQWRCSI